MQTQLVKVKDLKNNTGQIEGLPKNPRILKDDKFIKLKKSLEDDPEMLQLREVIVYDNNGELIVICGNMRLKALKELGIKEVPTKILPSDTPIEKLKAYTIKDNVSFGDHDWSLLNDWDSEQLEDWGLELPSFETEVLEAEEDDFDTTPPEEPVTVLGDLYEIGEHRLLCGDSTDSDSVALLMNGNKADMVFTDPPYGMAYESNAWDSKKNEVKQKRTDTQILNDENTNVGQDALNLIPLFLENNRHFYIWCRWDCFNDFKEVCENIGKIKSVIVWDKGGPGLGDLKGSYGDSEWAIFGMIGRRELKERQNGVWQVNRMKGLQMQHPTQKPLEICERGINNSSKVNELVLDLFLGSGSTMVASHQLKRKCYGMELDPKYCDVIVKRMVKLDPTLIVKRNGVVTKDFEL
jgi:site-specific DNA-methyltransferase (adenine-specific)